LAPDQAPEAMQLVACFAVQFKVALPPLVTTLGPTLRASDGAADLIDTLVDWVALPPEPWQVSVYVPLADSAPEVCEPFKGLVPDQLPEAAQVVALLTDHESVAAVPGSTVLGLAITLIAGGKAETVTVAVWVAEPPLPVQVIA